MPKLEEWRKSRHLSVREMAEATGLSTKTIIDLEKGRSVPQPRTVRLLSAALETAPTEIEEFVSVLPPEQKRRLTATGTNVHSAPRAASGSTSSAPRQHGRPPRNAEEQVLLAQASMPRLLALVDDLLSLSGSMGSMEGSRNSATGFRDDPLARAGFMIPAYAGKQTEHLQSVQTLVRAGLHRDAMLIARTMAEGTAQLRWAVDRYPDGTDLWFWYGVVEDWRQLKKDWKKGEEVDLDSDRVAQVSLSEHGSDYYTDEARRAVQARDPLPADPYRHQWYKSRIDHIFAAAAHSEIYDGLYRMASGWIHWSPRSLALCVDDSGGHSVYRVEDPRNAAIALAGSVLSLLLTLQIVDEFFGLDQRAKLAVLESRLSEIIGPVAED